MRFEWDPSKAAANLAKHGLAFEDAMRFDWDGAETVEDDRLPYDETRWRSIGDLDGRLSVIVYTFRAESVRIISLRKANRREVRRFEDARRRPNDDPRRES